MIGRLIQDYLDYVTLVKYSTQESQSGYSQMHKIGNIGMIVNFVIPYICSFLIYLHHDGGTQRIAFQGYRFHWSRFL